MSNDRPRVCIDVRMLEHAGIGTYIRNVVPRVMRQRSDWRYQLLARADAPVPREWLAGLDATVTLVRSGIYSVLEQLEIPLKQLPTDLFWAPHYATQAFSRGALVVTVHDVGHLALAEMYGGPARIAYARAMFGRVRRRAARILMVSDFTRREFEKHVGVTRAPITVTPEGVDPVWLGVDKSPTTRPRSRPYLLFVGSVKPHKNLRGAIGAFAQLIDHYAGDLVIVGDHEAQRTIDHAAVARGDALHGRVEFTGRIDDAQLQAHVAHADALIFPSLYEGFGLPPLEAMAAGCPCVVSDRGALPEVCGDAALYCDPLDESDIAQKVSSLLHDERLRRDLIDRGRARASAFSWDTTAALTARALTETLGHS